MRETFDEPGARAAGQEFVNRIGDVAECDRANRTAKPDDARPKERDLEIARLRPLPEPDPKPQPPEGAQR